MNMNVHPTPIFLSLSQRERIKVRDSLRVARRASSKSSPALHPDSRAHRDCRTSARESLHARDNGRLVDHVLVSRSKYAHHHRVPRLFAFRDNKNRGCTLRSHAVGETCSPRNFDCEDGARECARMALHFSAGSEPESLAWEVISRTDSEESESHFQRCSLPPHLNPLPRCGGEVDASARAEFRRPYRVLFGAQP